MSFCTKCGAKLQEGVKFCTKCGNAAAAPQMPNQTNNSASPPSAPVAPIAAAPVPPAVPVPTQTAAPTLPDDDDDPLLNPPTAKKIKPAAIAAACAGVLVLAIIIAVSISPEKQGDGNDATVTGTAKAISPVAELEKLSVGARASSIDGFVPDGWRKIASASGDLNKDNVDDAVIVIEATDPANKSDGANYNPRVLLALLSDGGGYTLAGKSGADFIPAESDRNNPCLADPLASGGVEITNRGVIRAVFNHKHKLQANCTQLQGSNLDRFIFRYQNNQFEMIGADKEKFDGGQFAVSINFSTKDIERKTPSAAMVRGKVEIDKLYNMGDSHNAYKFLDDAIAGRLATVNPRDRLVGTWYWTNGMSYWHEYNLRGDGTFRFREYNAHTGEGVDHPGIAGTWRLNGNKITTTYRNGTTETYTIIERGGKLYFNESGNFSDDYLRFEKSQ